jgi:hypothetical protein
MKIKEWLLGIIIAVVFLMFCVFGTKLIYDTPKYEDYCDYSSMNSPTAYDKMNLNDSELQAQQEAQNKIYQECSGRYDLANKNYSKNLFIISLVFGLVVIIICTIWIDINSISGGLMFGSLMFIIYGTSRYWNFMDDLLRFIILGVALINLIYVAYWVNKRASKNVKKKKRK